MEGSDETRPVTVDDAYSAQIVLDIGAMGTLEASRVADGHKNDHTIGFTAPRGVYDSPRTAERTGGTEGDRGFQQVLVTDADDPYLDHWWPPGHVLGWEHTFVHENYEFLSAVPTAGFRLRPSTTASQHSESWTPSSEVTTAASGSACSAVEPKGCSDRPPSFRYALYRSRGQTQCGQVHLLQGGDDGRRGRGKLPFHDHRSESRRELRSHAMPLSRQRRTLWSTAEDGKRYVPVELSTWPASFPGHTRGAASGTSSSTSCRPPM